MSFFPFDAQGKLTTIAGRVWKSKVVSTATYTASAELDETIFTDSTAAPIAITLPAGVNGQIFFFEDSTGQAGANNVTFLPTGGDTIQTGSTINSNYGARVFQYNSATGVWQIISSVMGSGAVSGDPNTVAYFGSSGALTDN